MDFASFLGSVGTVVGLIRAVPQLVRLLRAREAYGVSLDSAATSSIVSFGWATYGMLTDQLYVSLATGSSGLIFAIITVYALRFGHSSKEFKVVPFWFLVLLLAGVFYGKSGLGIMLPISVLAANTPQLVGSLQRRKFNRPFAGNLGTVHSRWPCLGYLLDHSAGLFHYGVRLLSVDHQRIDRDIKVTPPRKRKEICIWQRFLKTLKQRPIK
jgi:uncharacterized protein with PQ loop repeat